MTVKKQVIINLMCNDEKCHGYMTADPSLKGTGEQKTMHVCNVCSQVMVIIHKKYPIYKEEKSYINRYDCMGTNNKISTDKPLTTWEEKGKKWVLLSLPCRQPRNIHLHLALASF